MICTMIKNMLSHVVLFCQILRANALKSHTQFSLKACWVYLSCMLHVLTLAIILSLYHKQITQWSFPLCTTGLGVCWSLLSPGSQTLPTFLLNSDYPSIHYSFHHVQVGLSSACIWHIFFGHLWPYMMCYPIQIKYNCSWKKAASDM